MYSETPLNLPSQAPCHFGQFRGDASLDGILELYSNEEQWPI